MCSSRIRTGLKLALTLVLASGCATTEPEPAAREAAVPSSKRPSPGPGLNPWILEVLHSYPLDGSHGYWWPKSSESSWEGTTQDVVYGGRRLTRGDPQRRSYCCGLTFEVYVRAVLQAAGGPVVGLTPDDLHELRLRFFGDSKVGERRRLVQFGLDSLELGEALDSLEEARAGDFVQFWRHGGSGHSAIFINWVRKQDEIVGLTYWSSQSSTAGIGYRTEWIGEQEGIKREEIYLARASWPLSRQADHR